MDRKKQLHRVQQAAYYLRNKAMILAKARTVARERRREDPSKTREQERLAKARFRARHREECEAYSKAYYAKNKTELCRKERERHKANPERRRASERQRYAKNKQAILLRMREYMREWRKRPENKEIYRERNRSKSAIFHRKHPGASAERTRRSYHRKRAERLQLSFVQLTQKIP